MRILTTWLLCHLTLAACPQTTSEVIQAEKAFAQHAADSSVKSAFLFYMDSNAVGFDSGRIYRALEQWQQAPDTRYALLWHPAFYAAAASNDLGFTTGPFELRRSRKDTAIQSGQYTTVWVRHKAGQWKFLADIGIRYSPSLYNKQVLTCAPSLVTAPADANIMEVENNFIRHFKDSGLAAYASRVIPETWFNHDNRVPWRGLLPFNHALSALVHFVPVASGISASQDLAYVYGNLQDNGRKRNYLRIWAHTASGWMILVEVIA